MIPRDLIIFWQDSRELPVRGSMIEEKRCNQLQPMPCELGGQEAQLLPPRASPENNGVSFKTTHAVVTEAGAAFDINSL